MQPFPPEYLQRLVTDAMPYGKYAGTKLADLPEPYLVWLAGKGFPNGQLGELLALIHEIKVNGLEPLLAPLRGRAARFNPYA